MMRGSTFLLFILLFAAACDRQPRNILPIDRMSRVMWDVIQADEYVTSYISRDSSKNEKLERMKLYQKIFKLNKVSEQDYYTSFKYYAGKPGKYKTLMDSLSNRSGREQRNFQSMRTQPPAPQKVKDSIHRTR